MGESKKGSRRKMKWEKKPKQKEWWKRSSTEEHLSHFFIKTFCKVQKPYCILSVNLKRWKEQGAEGCNFHVYPQVLRRNLPLPYNLIQYLEVQTQIKQRLWSPEIPAEQGVLSWGRKVPAVLEEHECKAAETEDMSSNPLSFACAKSLIESMGGICHGMPESCWSACQPALLASSALGEHTLPGWKAGSECSIQGEIKQKRLCSHPQCCWAQEKMLLQPKHPKKTDLAVGDIEKSSGHCPAQLVLGGPAWVERLIRPWEVSSHSRYSVVPQFYFST